MVALEQIMTPIAVMLIIIAIISSIAGLWFAKGGFSITDPKKPNDKAAAICFAAGLIAAIIKILL